MLSQREPVYQGESLTEWLQPQDSDSKEAQAQEAVRRIGTNAIPVLLKMMKAQDSQFLAFVSRLTRGRFPPRHESAWEKRQTALRGFEILGKQAKSSVHGLTRIIDNDRYNVHALAALRQVNPSAAEITPALLRWATSSSSNLRSDAVLMLSEFKCESSRAVPVLVKALQDPELSVRIHALVALERYGPLAKEALPVLLEYQKNDTTSRSASAIKAIQEKESLPTPH